MLFLGRICELENYGLAVTLVSPNAGWSLPALMRKSNASKPDQYSRKFLNVPLF